MYRDYDKLYFKELKNPWYFNGDVAINEIFSVYKLEDKKVLDLGFGVGRHIKEFSKFNCSITGVEVSKIGIKRTQDFAKKNKKEIELFEGDMFVFKIKKKFDVIFSFMALQYAKDKKQFNEMIEKIQEKTKKGGINYIKVPTKGMSMTFPYLIKDITTLKKLYTNWEIIYEKFEKRISENKSVGSYALIIAKKI